MKYSWRCKECDAITTLKMSVDEYHNMTKLMENDTIEEGIPLCRSCGSPNIVRMYDATLVIYRAKGFYSTGG